MLRAYQACLRGGHCTTAFVGAPHHSLRATLHTSAIFGVSLQSTTHTKSLAPRHKSFPSFTRMASTKIETPKVTKKEDSDSDDIPLANLAKSNGKSTAKPTTKTAPKEKAAVKPKVQIKSDSDSDDIPLANLKATKKPTTPKKKPATPKKAKKEESSSDNDSDIPVKKRQKTSSSSTIKKVAPKKESTKKSEADDGPLNDWWNKTDNNLPEGHKWRTMHHNGMLFPPPYTPHGIKMKYDGKEVELDAEAEEIATWYAAKLDLEHTKKEKFNNNFFRDFLEVLNPPGSKTKHIIKSFDKCDFTPIYMHLKQKQEERKNRSKEERQAEKAEKEKLRKQYGIAIVDGVKEKISNYNMEPPGLFCGRGDHPKTGCIKKRVMPEDVTLNLSKDAPVPPCPVPGHKWGAVVERPTATWLALWKDTVMNDSKYMFLAPSAKFRGEKDLAKYEKARHLANRIDVIRSDYTKALKSEDAATAQLGTAMWVIDRLALRVGNEKDTDQEADTVGCCSLRIEHVKLLSDNMLELDFLGKDSIRYCNTVKLDPQVYKNIQRFVKGKKPHEDLFDQLTTAKLNKHLGSLMKGLSAKVFRTYNASVTLEKCLREAHEETLQTDVVAEKVAIYNRANREVAILCNHQRAAPKNFEQQIGRMDEKIEKAVRDLEDAKEELKALKKIASSKKEGQVPIVTRKKKDEDDADDDTSNAKKRKRKDDDDDDDDNSKSKAKGKGKGKGKGKESEKDKDNDPDNEEDDRQVEMRTFTPEQAEKRVSVVEKKVARAKTRVATLRSQRTTKEDQKTVSLGTSKINYCDPRITVAWCKLYDVPLNRIFNKSLLEKFPWAFHNSSVDQKWEFVDPTLQETNTKKKSGGASKAGAKRKAKPKAQKAAEASASETSSDSGSDSDGSSSDASDSS